MNRKIFISFLVVALFNLVVGCYSFERITVPEYMAEIDKPDEILVTTKDFKKYSFSHSNFYIENDTLYGKGELPSNERRVLLDKKIALSDILFIEVENIDWLNSCLIGGGIGLGIIVLLSILALHGLAEMK